MLHVTSQFLYVGNIVPEEQVVGVLVPAEVVQPDDGEVAGEAQEAGAGPRLAGRGRAEAGGRPAQEHAGGALPGRGRDTANTSYTRGGGSLSVSSELVKLIQKAENSHRSDDIQCTRHSY